MLRMRLGSLFCTKKSEKKNFREREFNLERGRAWKLGIACKIEELWKGIQVLARICLIEDLR